MNIGTVVGLIKALGATNPETIKEGVAEWLDDHPEATTTVEDGAVSRAKLDEDLKQKTDEVANLHTAINQKQDAPETDGTAGQVLSLDSNLDPVWSTPSGGGGAVNDVQINGVSVLDAQGVANVPVAENNVYGAAKLSSDYNLKAGQFTTVVSTDRQHKSLFYALAKLAGADMKNVTGETVGVYPEAQKSAISQMLDAPETVSGTTPSITAKPGVRYVCGECATLTIVAPASGCIDVTFTSGSTATVLTVSSAKTGVSAIKWANGFDPTSLDANTTYEVNILDGEFGVVGSWT